MEYINPFFIQIFASVSKLKSFLQSRFQILGFLVYVDRNILGLFRGAKIKALYIYGELRKLWRDRKVVVEYVVKET